MKLKKEFNFLEIIENKKQKKLISYWKWDFFIKKVLNDEIPNYQVSAFLMTIYFNSLFEKEVFWLTKLFIKYSKKLKLQKLNKSHYLVDKHSTGGIGDKISILFLPFLKKLNFKIAKLSGKGLGDTGGTIDKLSSVPGLNINLDYLQIQKQINEFGIVLSSQQDICPIDAKIYSLRDVTRTIDSIPLIAISIMAKKILLNSDLILIDLKYGEAGFCKNLSTAKQLSSWMIKIANYFKKKAIIVITKMDKFLGKYVGNFLEVYEAVNILKQKYKNKKLFDLEIEGLLIFFISIVDFYFSNKNKNNFLLILEKNWKILKKQTIFPLLKNWFFLQGAKDNFFNDLNKTLFQIKYKLIIKSKESGYLNIITLKLKQLMRFLRITREKITTSLDLFAGIIFLKKEGEFCKKSENIIIIYSNEIDISKYINDFKSLYYLSKIPKKKKKLIYYLQTTNLNKINNSLISVFNNFLKNKKKVKR